MTYLLLNFFQNIWIEVYNIRIEIFMFASLFFFDEPVAKSLLVVYY